MHADRINRVMLILFGLLVLAVGAAAMAASTGVFGASFSRQSTASVPTSATTAAGCGPSSRAAARLSPSRA
jgi:hypothetical protein